MGWSYLFWARNDNGAQRFRTGAAGARELIAHHLGEYDRFTVREVSWNGARSGLHEDPENGGTTMLWIGPHHEVYTFIQGTNVPFEVFIGLLAAFDVRDAAWRASVLAPRLGARVRMDGLLAVNSLEGVCSIQVNPAGSLPTPGGTGNGCAAARCGNATSGPTTGGSCARPSWSTPRRPRSSRRGKPRTRASRPSPTPYVRAGADRRAERRQLAGRVRLPRHGDRLCSRSPPWLRIVRELQQACAGRTAAEPGPDAAVRRVARFASADGRPTFVLVVSEQCPSCRARAVHLAGTPSGRVEGHLVLLSAAEACAAWVEPAPHVEAAVDADLLGSVAVGATLARQVRTRRRRGMAPRGRVRRGPGPAPRGGSARIVEREVKDMTPDYWSDVRRPTRTWRRVRRSGPGCRDAPWSSRSACSAAPWR